MFCSAKYKNVFYSLKTYAPTEIAGRQPGDKKVDRKQLEKDGRAYGANV